MSENQNNPIRAARAETGLTAYVEALGDPYNGDEPACLQEHVSDLLCDLMHLCKQRGVDFDACLATGLTNHEAEEDPDDIEENFLASGGLFNPLP